MSKRLLKFLSVSLLTKMKDINKIIGKKKTERQRTLVQIQKQDSVYNILDSLPNFE